MQKLAALFIFYVCFFTSVTGQVTPQQAHHIDSLQKELQKAQHDSTRIKLRYQIGQIGITRTGYWDSLATDAHKCKMMRMEGLARNIEAHFYWNLNEFEKAYKCYEKSYEIAVVNGYKLDIIYALNGLAAYYNYKRDYNKTIKIYYLGRRIADQLNDHTIAAYLYSIAGSTYFAMGEIHMALPIHFRCLDIYKKLNDTNSIAQELCNIGADYHAMHDTIRGVKYYLKSKSYINGITDPMIAAYTINAIGAAYNHLGQYDSAYAYCKKAYRIADKIGHKYLIVGVLVTLANISYQKKNFVQAKKEALEALQMVHAIDFLLQIPPLAHLLKDLYIQEGNYKEALKMHEMMVAARDSLTREDNKKLAMQKEFDYNLQKKDNENKLLAQQNQIQALKLSQSNYLIAALLAGIIFIFIISFLFIRQNRLRASQQNIQMEQKLLRSQMNPHFIFNSLQAIQNYILKQESMKAVKYLSSFANITRAVLESSRLDLIPLQKEIALLENYLQLQKLRFGNRFDYRIHIDQSVDVEQINVPPMLSQPFIENAVEHGMQGIEHGGNIAVHYSLEGNLLRINITDNGWGMNPKNQPAKKHQSLAMEITRERITLMNKKKKQKTFFTITEAFPFEQVRKGVKVTFFLPLAITY